MNPSTTTLAEPQRPATVPRRADRHGVTVVIEVHGELDLLTAPRLRALLMTVLASRPALLVIDLLAAESVGVSGLAVLAEARQVAGERTRLRVIAAEPVARLLRLTGMDNLDERSDGRVVIGSDR